MVRHFTFITTVLVVMGLLTHIDAKAQGQDQHHLWIGNPLNKIVDKGDTDMGTVYLYNVGTGKFLNTGSYWGTAVVGFNVGMTTHVLSTSKPNTYKMTGPLVTTEGKTRSIITGYTLTEGSTGRTNLPRPNIRMVFWSGR